MVYTPPLERHSVLTVVRQKYLVTFFRCVVVIETSLALAYPSKNFVTILHEKNNYKKSLLARDEKYQITFTYCINA